MECGISDKVLRSTVENPQENTVGFSHKGDCSAKLQKGKCGTFSSSKNNAEGERIRLHIGLLQLTWTLSEVYMGWIVCSYHSHHCNKECLVESHVRILSTIVYL